MADINTFHYRQKKNIRLIAEIGQAHDGSLGFAHSYIDSLKNTEN